jgi:hypothetical protein
MDLSEKVNYAISIASIIVAIWQTIKAYNLKRYIKAESMELYTDTDTLRGSVQACKKALQSGNIYVGIQEAGMAEGMAHSLFTRSIKNIYHHFNYKREDIDDWIKNKRIHETHRDDFMRYADK